MLDNITMFLQFRVKARGKSPFMLQKSNHGKKTRFVWHIIL